MTTIRGFLAAMTRNPLSLLGATITTAAAVLIMGLFVMELSGHLGNPYIGILAYLILPGLLLIGLILIPIGVYRDRRALFRRGADAATRRAFPVVDLNKDRVRWRLLVFFGFSVINFLILGTATFKGVEVMESTEFCGQACHTVMQPEYTAYLRSPHSRVSCVECHIGPGADWFVKSKLSGAWQVVSATFELYPRPVPTPVHDLRPARETCEQCHWPTKFVGDRLRVITHYGNDEQNTESKTVLVMKVGGRQGGRSHGIHWHVDPEVQVRYRSDPTRETVYEVEMTRPDGTVTRFKRPGAAAEAPSDSAEGWRTMDCVDCHNRPSHIFRSPEQELDAALLAGDLDRELPFVRREGLRLMNAGYVSHAEARASIPAGLTTFYQENYPQLVVSRADAILSAGHLMAELYAVNVFPAMNLDWNTHLNHIGHESSPGCFRCHDDELASEDGTTISQDCFACHGILAIEEEDPEILSHLEL